MVLFKSTGMAVAVTFGLALAGSFCKSGGPPLFAPSLKVQGDDTRNDSGFSVIRRPQSPNNFPEPCEWRWAQVCSK